MLDETFFTGMGKIVSLLFSVQVCGTPTRLKHSSNETVFEDASVRMTLGPAEEAH